MNSSNSCNICCDHYNKSTRSKVCCPYCDFEVCRTCCETYILDESVPKCMKPGCAKEWSRKFLRENFTNTFLTSRYKTHLENVLFDQEKALLPATQPLVEEKVRKQNIKREIKALNDLIRDLEQQVDQLENSYKFGGGAAAAKDERSRFVRQCPANGCRGFLSTQWKCGICEQWTCPDCHELKGPNRDCAHTCDPNNVETAKMLAKDSKPCPKCQSMIFKIEGCDQMWCTQCHTAFSWKTGKLESHIHNPHYYEWQRKNGGLARAAGDIECGRDLTHYTVNQLYELAKKHSDLHMVETKQVTSWSGRKETRTIYNYGLIITEVAASIRVMIHNRDVEQHQFRTDYVTRNQDLRIKYMEGLIGENEFKMLIQRNDKKNRKNNEISQVLQVANTAFTDIIYRMMDNLEKSENGKHSLAQLKGEFDGIIQYCNDILRDIAFTYGTIQYGFHTDFTFGRVAKEKKEKKSGAASTDDDESISDLSK